MALSLDDRLLGEKTDYYCSSSSDEEGEDNAHKRDNISSAVPDVDVNKYTGHCVNVSADCRKCLLNISIIFALIIIICSTCTAR